MAQTSPPDATPPVYPEALAELETFELPSLRPRDLLAHFGPGMILMMTGIGTSHLVTAPTAGGRFAYALLWCLPVAYIFKYYGFEMAFRFTNATGKSLLEAYSTAWRKWPLWYVLVTTIIQCAIGQAGRLIAAAAVLYYLFSEELGLGLSLEIYALALGLLSVIVILRGRYAVIEGSAKFLAGVLVASTLAVYLVQPAPLAEMGHFFLVDFPDGSWLVIASFLGLLPTGIDVSLQASEWGKAKRAGMSKVRPRLERAGLATPFDPFEGDLDDLTIDVSKLSPHAKEYCRRWFRIGLWDFRAGHVISFVLAAIFLLLAAMWLYPSEVSGTQVMGEIAGMFTLSVGPWMMGVFVVGALAATFSTAFNYFDGWPRIVGACCRNLFRGTARLKGVARRDLSTRDHVRVWYSEYNIYRMTMFYSLIASVVFIAFVPRPVFLVLVASALAAFVAPVIYYLNLYYCLRVIPKEDRVFYPSRFDRWFGGFSLFVFTGLTGILIAARVFGIALFGG
ncbi:MAG: Nramp family divalent metal transporter [Gemmatimonadota bacterium]|nr:Nramp family divalent metal transporter [Gemmatimonadota bacterium]